MPNVRRHLACLLPVLGACATSTPSTPAASTDPALAVIAAPAEQGLALEQTPAAWQPALTRARTASGELGQRLRTRVQEAMQQGGAASAIGVCRDQAPAITAELEATHQLRLGRTSHRLRNPANAVPTWLRPLIERLARGEDPPPGPRAFDLGISVGLAHPIPTGEACLRCHGPVEALDPALREALQQAYPDDVATGFAVGALRGYTWAEVPLE